LPGWANPTPASQFPARNCRSRQAETDSPCETAIRVPPGDPPRVYAPTVTQFNHFSSIKQLPQTPDTPDPATRPCFRFRRPSGGPPGAQSCPGPQIARSQPVLTDEPAGPSRLSQSRISQFRLASPTPRPSATKRERWPPTACQSFDDGAPQDTGSPYWDCSCRTRRRPDCRGSASHRRPESRTPAPRWPAVSCS